MNEPRPVRSLADEYLEQLRRHQEAHDATHASGAEGNRLPSTPAGYRPSTQPSGQAAARSSTSAPVTGAASDLTPAHMDRLWVRMAGMFFDLWTNRAGTSDDGTWLASMRRSGLMASDVARGLASIERSGSTYPPSLPEFIRLCRPLQGMAGQQAASAPVSRAKALPITDEERTRRREVAFRHMDEIRRILKMPPAKRDV